MSNKGHTSKSNAAKKTAAPSSKSSKTGIREIEENLLLRDDDQVSVASQASNSSRRTPRKTTGKKTTASLEIEQLDPVAEQNDVINEVPETNPSSSVSSASVYTRYQCQLSNGKDCPIADCLVHHKRKRVKKTKIAGDQASDTNEYSSDDSSESDEDQIEEATQQQPPSTARKLNILSSPGVQNLARALKKNGSITMTKQSSKTSSVTSRKTTTIQTSSSAASKITSNGKTSLRAKSNGKERVSSSLDLFSSDEEGDGDYVVDTEGPVIRYITEFVTLRRFKRHPYVERISEILDEVTPEPVKKASKSVHSFVKLRVPHSVQRVAVILLFWCLLSLIGILPSPVSTILFLTSLTTRFWNITCCLFSSASLPSFLTTVPSIALPVITFPSFSSFSSPSTEQQQQQSIAKCTSCPPPPTDAQLQARIQQLESRLQELLLKEPTVIPVEQPDFESLVKEAVSKSSSETRREILEWLKSQPEFLPKSSESSVTLDDVQKMILLYDADKTGMTDYAFEPSGGTIVSKHCSDTYDVDNQNFKIFGVHLFSSSNSPRKVIQAGNAPGNCWSFRGSNGYVTIRLGRKIIPTSFSLEHAQKRLLPENNIDSAVKDFMVEGLRNPDETEGAVLGRFQYEDDESRPIQTFQVGDPNPGVFGYIRLNIHSNHGNQDYTCVYRFRVHGRLPPYQ
jgi:SUN domain-containing protein 1/2